MTVCNWETKDLAFREQAFIKHYESICRTGIGDGSPLLGFVDSKNLPEGHAAGEVVRIACDLPPHAFSQQC